MNYENNYIEFIKSALSYYTPSPNQNKSSYLDKLMSNFYPPTSINLESVTNLTTLQKLEQNYIFNGTPTFIHIADADLQLPSIVNGDLILIGDNIKDTLPTLQTTVTGTVTLLGSGVEANIASKNTIYIHNMSASITNNIDDTKENTFTRTQGAVENQTLITNDGKMGIIEVYSKKGLDLSNRTLFEGNITAPTIPISFFNSINNGTINGNYIILKNSLNNKVIISSSFTEFNNANNNGSITAGTHILFNHSQNNGHISANGSYVRFISSENKGNVTAHSYVEILEKSTNSGDIESSASVELTQSRNDGKIVTNACVAIHKSENRGSIAAGTYVELRNSLSSGTIDAGTYVTLINSTNTGTIKENIFSTKK